MAWSLERHPDPADGGRGSARPMHVPNESRARRLPPFARRAAAVLAVGVAAAFGACSDDDDPTGLASAQLPRPDSQMQAVLEQLARIAPRPLETLTPAEARLQPSFADAFKQVLLAQGRDTAAAALVPGVTAADRTIAAPGVPALPVRVYTPSGTGPFPVVVYYHGGGWVIATNATYDASPRTLASLARAVVVSVEYRKGPENRFPAAHDDALAAYRWVIANARTIAGDSTRVALAGESAGGNLAVATAVAAQGAGLRRPAHVVAVYPIAQADTTTPSYAQNANARPLNRALIGYFARNYTRTPADLLDPRISLTRAALAGLPAVTIVNAEIDPLRSDGDLLEQALRAAGVSVERRVYDGVTHEFFGMGALVPDARAAEEYAAGRLRGAFGN